MVLAALDLKLVLAVYVVKECYERTKDKDFFQNFLPTLHHLSLPWDSVSNYLLEGDKKRDKVPHTLWRK